MPSKKIILTTILASLALFGCIATTLPDNRPKNTNPTTVDVQEVKTQSYNFLIAKIDPSFFQFKIVQNAAPPDSLSLDETRQNLDAEITFNGSFYNENFQPLGLLISEGHLLAPLKKSDLMNGIFTIDQKHNPTLYGFDDFGKQQTKLLPKIDFAIQSGPILIDDHGQVVIDSSNTKKSSRTALAIDKEGNIVLIILRQGLLDQSNALTLYQFAEILSTSNELSSLGLHSMINLDGGKSTGLSTADHYYPEIEKVQNIITITKRN